MLIQTPRSTVLGQRVSSRLVVLVIHLLQARYAVAEFMQESLELRHERVIVPAFALAAAENGTRRLNPEVTVGTCIAPSYIRTVDNGCPVLHTNVKIGSLVGCHASLEVPLSVADMSTHLGMNCAGKLHNMVRGWLVSLKERGCFDVAENSHSQQNDIIEFHRLV